MKRPALWILIFMICGIYCRLGISLLVCLVCIFLCIVCGSYIVIKIKRKGYLLLLLAFPLGFLLTSYHGAENFVSASPVSVTGEGYVAKVERTSGGYPKLTVRADLTETATGEIHKDQKVYMIDMDRGTFTEGEEITFSGSAQPFDHGDIFSGYNEYLYLNAEGYDCKMFPESLEKTGEHHNTAGTIAAAWNHRVKNVLETILPQKERALAEAMITGDRDDIDAGIEELYTQAGVTHILCISGLHMSLLAFYISVILRRILHQSQRKTAAVTLCICLAFLFLTGFSPSSVRAMVMISLVCLGQIIYQRHEWLNSIALAALVILLVNPFYLWSAGFQLSFLSVLGIYVGSHVIPKGHTWYGKIGEMMGISFFAALFGMPVAAYHFYHISTVSVLANLVILPLSGILLGCTMLTALCGMIFLPAGVFMAGSVYVIFQIYEKVCQLVTMIPYSYVAVGKPSVIGILCFYGLVCLICFYRPQMRFRVGTAVCTALLLVMLLGNRLLWHRNTLAFLDVGQGDCAVLTTYDHRAIVIDGGGKYNKELGENTGTTILEPYLASKGVTQIDAVFLSHLDSDHSMGILELLNDMPVEGVYVSAMKAVDVQMEEQLQEIVEKNQISLYTMKHGDMIRSEAFGEMKCLFPIYVDQTAESENERSLVLRYVYGDTSVLFTGDLEAKEESLLERNNLIEETDILKVSHHGSKTASTESFLQALTPETAVISCGTNNLYGHPHKEVLERLSACGAEILRTDEMGSVVVNIPPEGTAEVTTAAERKPIYERIKEAMEGTPIP